MTPEVQKMLKQDCDFLKWAAQDVQEKVEQLNSVGYGRAVWAGACDHILKDIHDAAIRMRDVGLALHRAIDIAQNLEKEAIDEQAGQAEDV